MLAAGAEQELQSHVQDIFVNPAVEITHKDDHSSCMTEPPRKSTSAFLFLAS